MPGRGTPWRFGKGVKDRIGSTDIKDDTITSADIKDLTITEADLDSSVTTKLNKAGGHVIQEEGTPLTQRGNLNFVGAGVVASDGIEDTTTVTISGASDGVGYDEIQDEGTPLAKEPAIDFQGAGVTATAGTGKTIVTIPGGGGSNNLEGGIMFQYDFFEVDVMLIEETWNLMGGSEGFNFPIRVGGVVTFVGDGVAIGELIGLTKQTGSGTFDMFDFTGKDVTGKFGVGTTSTTDIDVHIGFVNNELLTGQNPASPANLETNITEGAFFRYNASGNWIAVTKTGGTETTTDTGVAPTANVIEEFKIKYEDATNVVFSIAGNVVATHTTNLPATDLGLLIGGAQLTTATKSIGIDYAQVEYLRAGGITEGTGTGGFPSTVPLTRYMIFEEFYWADDGTDSLLDKYIKLPTAGIRATDSIKTVGGVVRVESVTAGRGGGLGISKTTSGGGWTDPTKNVESKIRVGLGANQFFLGPLIDRIDFIGFMDNQPTNIGATDVASAEANFANGAYFRSLDGGNWQAVTMNTNTKTETDTGVAPVAGAMQNFEIIFTSSQIVFKINGSTVATHTTNLPIVLIFLMSYINNTGIGSNNSHFLDSWYIIGDR